MAPRHNQLAQAVAWCALSVAWAALAGATALIAGVAVGAIALIGFGADSIVDGSASAVLVWRFSAERKGASNADVVERRASRLVGGILVVIGVYLALAAATLISLLVESAFGWWWADAVAALLIAGAAAARRLAPRPQDEITDIARHIAPWLHVATDCRPAPEALRPQGPGQAPRARRRRR